MDSSELRPAEVIIGPARLLVLVVIETDSRTFAAEMGCGSVHATNPTRRENPSGAGGRAPGNVGSREAPGRVRPFHRRAHLGGLDGVSLPVPLLRWRFRPPAHLPVDRKGGGYQQRSVGRSIVSGERLLRPRSEEHTSELQSPCNLVCRLLLEKKKNDSGQPLHDE